MQSFSSDFGGNSPLDAAPEFTEKPEFTDKQVARRYARQQLRAITEEERQRVGQATATALLPLLPREGRFVGLYSARQDEVPMEPSWRIAQAQGCFLALPQLVTGGDDDPIGMVESDTLDGEAVPYSITYRRVRESPTLAPLQDGPFGIREPDPDMTSAVPPKLFTMLLIPGLMFDARGGRLGRGKGHFDRFLAGLPPTCLKIGVGYKCQFSKDPLPLEEFDVPMNALIIDGELFEPAFDA